MSQNGSELPPNYDISYLGSTPIHSTQKHIRGICSFENCNLKSKEGFFSIHHKQVQRVQDMMALGLRIKCQANYHQNRCHLHLYTKLTSKDNFESNDVRIMSQKYD